VRHSGERDERDTELPRAIKCPVKTEDAASNVKGCSVVVGVVCACTNRGMKQLGPTAALNGLSQP